MRIIQLQAENVKRLRAVDITPTDDLVVIAGRNGQGKTSVLDAIMAALGGASAVKDMTRPIRDGEDSAYVVLDLGEYTVTRTWKGDKTTLQVESKDGARYPSPQAMLDKLIGKLSFDPLAFSHQPDKDQLATLLALIDYDPTELDAERAEAFATRTDVGRTVKQLEGEMAGMPQAPEDLPPDEVSVSALVAELEEAREARSYRATLTEARERRVATVARLAEELQRAEEALATADKQIAKLPPNDPDVDAIHARLDAAEGINSARRTEDARLLLGVRLMEASSDYASLTETIRRVDHMKEVLLGEAKMPIDGLGFDADGVTFQGVPFRQCSAAEQLRISLAIAMASNPSIRVIRITDGSLLDSQNMKLIADMAAANDFQVWIERVDETGKVGILIEDGLAVATT